MCQASVSRHNADGIPDSLPLLWGTRCETYSLLCIWSLLSNFLDVLQLTPHPGVLIKRDDRVDLVLSDSTRVFTPLYHSL